MAARTQRRVTVKRIASLDTPGHPALFVETAAINPAECRAGRVALAIFGLIALHAAIALWRGLL